MPNVMPRIIRTKQTLAPNGLVMESKSVTVQGESLEEIQKIMDKEWKECE